MTTRINFDFQEELKSSIYPFPFFVRYTGMATLTTPDKNGDDLDRATVEILPETFRIYFEGVTDPFAVLPDEKHAPLLYARIREEVKLAYITKRMVWQ